MLVDDLLHTSRKIIANLDEMEDRVFDETKPVARSIALLRREINRLRRIANPLKKFVLEIARSIKKFSEREDEELTLYFDDVIDHIDKVIETLEESRETMEIYKDTDFVLSTEKTNKVLAVLNYHIHFGYSLYGDWDFLWNECKSARRYWRGFNGNRPFYDFYYHYFGVSHSCGFDVCIF